MKLLFLLLIIPYLPLLSATNFNESFKLSPDNVNHNILKKVLTYYNSNYDSAHYYINLVEPHVNNEEEEFVIRFTYTKALLYLTWNKNIDELKPILLEGLKLSIDKGYDFYTLSFYNLIGVYYRKHPEKSFSYFEKAYLMAKKIKNEKRQYALAVNLTLQGFVLENDTLSAFYFNEQDSLFKRYKSILPSKDYYHYYSNKSRFVEGYVNKNLMLDSAQFYVPLKEDVYFYYQAARQKIMNLMHYDNSMELVETELFNIIEDNGVDKLSKRVFYKDLIEYYLCNEKYQSASEWFNRYNSIYPNAIYLSEFKSSNKFGYNVYKNTNVDSALYYLVAYTEELEAKNTKTVDSLIYKMEQNIDVIETEMTHLKEVNKYETKLFVLTVFLILFIGGVLFYYLINRKSNKAKKKELELITSYYEKEKKLNSQRERFLENMTHEIKTPITVISGLIDVVNNSKHAQGVQEMLDIITLNTNQLKYDIRSIVDYNEKVNGIEENLVKVNLLQEIVDLTHLFKFQIKSKNIEIVLYHNVLSDFDIQFEMNKFRIIFNNFLNNALRHSFEGGKIEIHLNVVPGFINIKVKDFGTGISKTDLPLIFDRFYQASTNEIGQGIGLSIVKEISNKMNATLSAESDPINGTVLSVVIPVSTTYKTKHQFTEVLFSKQESKMLVTPCISSKQTILFVDDNEFIHHFYQSIFPEYNCVFSFDVSTALEKLDKNNIDCIVSDIMMPGMNGFEFLDHLKGHNKKIPFLFVTAKENYKDKIKALHLGVMDYIIKPFDVRELQVRVDNVIKNFNRMKLALDNDDVQIDNLSADTDREYSSEEFINRVKRNIEKNIDNPEFNIGLLAESVFYSESQLRRLIKIKTGLSPNKLILEIKLLKAKELIHKYPEIKVFEIQEKVAIKSSAYFSKVFKERFGITPSQLLKEKV